MSVKKKKKNENDREKRFVVKEIEEPSISVFVCDRFFINLKKF